MKKDIHPNYGEATITCACGNVIKTRSTKKEMTVNTCSACHPYFTGQKTMVDTEGRVTFNSRFLIDALNSLESKEIEFEFSDRVSPTLLRNKKDNKYTHIVMPLSS